MRRFFLRPTALRVLLAMIATFATYIFVNPASSELLQSKASFNLGVSIAYLWVGPTNPILKFATLLVFWFVISWLTYIVIYTFEIIYVRAFNAYVIKTKYVNRAK